MTLSLTEAKADIRNLFIFLNECICNLPEPPEEFENMNAQLKKSEYDRELLVKLLRKGDNHLKLVHIDAFFKKTLN